jgi:hypothetical protein
MKAKADFENRTGRRQCSQEVLPSEGFPSEWHNRHQRLQRNQLLEHFEGDLKGNNKTSTTNKQKNEEGH